MTEHESSPGLQDNTELLHRISARLSDRFAGIGESVTVYSAGTRPGKSLNPRPWRP